jgi:hypothetical protein
MKSHCITIIGLFVFFINANAQHKDLKPRIVVLTDIAPVDVEPDDMESMVRLFVHADLVKNTRNCYRPG